MSCVERDKGVGPAEGPSNGRKRAHPRRRRPLNASVPGSHQISLVLGRSPGWAGRFLIRERRPTTRRGQNCSRLANSRPLQSGRNYARDRSGDVTAGSAQDFLARACRSAEMSTRSARNGATRLRSLRLAEKNKSKSREGGERLFTARHTPLALAFCIFALLTPWKYMRTVAYSSVLWQLLPHARRTIGRPTWARRRKYLRARFALHFNANFGARVQGKE